MPVTSSCNINASLDFQPAGLPTLDFGIPRLHKDMSQFLNSLSNPSCMCVCVCVCAVYCIYTHLILFLWRYYTSLLTPKKSSYMIL